MGIDRGVRRAVFLDRDGVITRAVVREGKPFAPASDETLEIIPGTAAVLARLRDAGFQLVVVTNQPDVARGSLSRAVLDRMHERLLAELPLDEIRTCDHDDRDECDCRKPKPGLLIAAARDHGLSLRESFIIGDRWRDVEAGARAGCRTLFIDYGYDERRPRAPDAIVHSLAEAADWILARTPGNAE